MNIQLGIPFYSDFEDAKSGLRELMYEGIQIAEWTYKYKSHVFTIEPRQGNHPKGELSNSLVYIAICRNNLVRPSDNISNFSLFVFIDSDICWTLADLMKLISHNKPVVCAPFLDRSAVHYQQGIWEYPGIIDYYFTEEEKGFKSIDATGFGMVSVQREVFVKLEYPWFRHTMIEKDGHKEEVGEDWGFCMLCTEAKIPIYCDFNIKIKHNPQQLMNWRI